MFRSLNGWMKTKDTRFGWLATLLVLTSSLVSGLKGSLADSLLERIGMRAGVALMAALAFMVWLLSRPAKLVPGNLPPRRLHPSGFEVLVGSLPPEGFEVSARGNILCPCCRNPVKVSAPHAGMDALVACAACDVIAVADRNVGRLLGLARALAREPRGTTHTPDRFAGLVAAAGGAADLTGFPWN